MSAQHVVRIMMLASDQALKLGAIGHQPGFNK
jgi:hypothetical protein